MKRKNNYFNILYLKDQCATEVDVEGEIKRKSLV